MKNLLKLMSSVIGESITYRLGRALYMMGRCDTENNININGELLLQDVLIAAWERTTNENLSEHIEAKKCFIVFDIGANIGKWSIPLLNKFRNKNITKFTLHAFEPVPSTFEKLKANMNLQEPFEGYLNQLAISSSIGESQIFIKDEPCSGTNGFYTDIDGKTAKAIAVTTKTVTSYCAEYNIDKINILKIDTEGHDMEVMRGALPMLAKGQIWVLQFEYNHRWIYARNYLRDVFLLVSTLDYSVAKLQSGVFLVFDEWHFELEKFFEGNYVLIHNKLLDLISVRHVKFDAFNAMTTSCD
jgi:FkbM family methyltransferase